MVDWTNIIIAAIGTGGLTGLFLIAERKTSAALKNMQVMFDNLQRLYDKLQIRYDVETDKVGKLYDQISEKNEKLDAANTKAATSELKRCDCITCQRRVPPLSDQWRMDVAAQEKGGWTSTATERRMKHEQREKKGGSHTATERRGRPNASR